jgi:hypothetical protein
MKRIARIVLCGWVLCTLLSGTGARAAQEQKAPQAPIRMVFADSAVRVFTDKFKLDSERQKILESKLNEIATEEYKVALDTAREIALSVRDMPMSEKIKRPEEDIVAQFLPRVVAEQLGGYAPLRWNLQFKSGELVRDFMGGPKFAESLNFTGIRSCANGHYVAFEQNLDMGSRKIVVWDMLKMEQDEALSYTIFFEKSRPVWDIAPERDLLVYQADGSIVGVSLASKKDDQELFRKKVGSNVDYLTFSWDGSKILGYTRGLGALDVWDAATGNKIEAESQALTQSLASLPITKKITGGIADYSVLSPGGKKLAVIKNKKVIEIWDLGTQSLRQTIQADDKRYFDPQSCVFDDGGDRLAVISNNGAKSVDNAGKPALEVWDLVAGIRVCSEPQKNTSFLSYANRTAFSPDGLWLVTSFHEKGGFKIWSLPELQKKYALKNRPPVSSSEVPGAGSGQRQAGTAGPAHRVTVDEFMETLEGLMEEDQLDEVRKQLRELSQTSPDNKIDEALAQQIADDVLRAAAPRELPGQSDDDLPPLEDVSGAEDSDEKAEVAQMGTGAPSAESVRRLTIAQARKEFAQEVRQLSTQKQRDLWDKELNNLAAQSRDIKVDYKEAERLLAEIASLQGF